MITDRRWVQRLISEEKPAAAVLLLAGMVGLLAANLLGAEGIESVLHPTVAGHVLDLPWFAADGLLTVFFFVAGLELRHEFTEGSLTTAREAAVPVVAAMLGMIMPAAIFILLAPAAAGAAWGVPMATDLPLALALVAVVGAGLPLSLRAFILSLAIVDDALSILVIAIVFGGSLSPLWCLATALLAWLYTRVQPRSMLLAGVVALAAWGAMLNTGIHATVLGVVLGLLTSHRTDSLRNRWQPFSGLVAVPLFVATSLAIPLSMDAVNDRLVIAVTAARIIGKPLGIMAGAALAVHFFKPATALRLSAYGAAGCVAALGFSVSMLFAELGLGEPLLAQTKVAVVISMLLSGLVGTVALKRLRRSMSTE